MMYSYTPLRYPGGKAKLYKNVKRLIENNFPKKPAYCEPFAGGAGLALKLLLNDIVTDIYINDLDDAIYSFWYSLINHKEELVHLIETTPVNMVNWNISKNIYENPEDHDVLTKGFATFFLNRTNRSGIMKAGPIGGKNQNGNYKMDSRFNKESLIKVINAIYKYKDHIHLYKMDAIEYVPMIDSNVDNVFIYLDPPYVKKGPGLYKNAFNLEDHKELRDVVNNINNKWFITYDDHEYIEELYKDYFIDKFQLSYTVATKRKGTEISIFSNRMIPGPI